jgi:hypothetical protein
MKKTKCRIDGSELIDLFSLGNLCVSDFIINESPGKYPLSLTIGKDSGLVQLSNSVNPDTMYTKYWYRSGTNQTMTNELQSIAESITHLARLQHGDILVDIGCNDGTLLKFIDASITRVGFDPSKNGYKEVAQNYANFIIDDYFSKSNYNNIFNKKAKAITSIAMFYDLDDPNAFVSDVYDILDDNGLWVIQMSYTPLMLKQLAFDNICHEHIEYYTLQSIEYLLDRHDLKVVDCQLNDINGGSFRLYVKKKDAVKNFSTQPYRDICDYRTESIRQMEKSLRLGANDGLEIYHDFYKKIVQLKDDVCSFIREERSKHKTIVGYGASTKGNTLLQYFGLDNSLISAIAERSPSKYGLKTVATNIPIIPEDEMRKMKPDYLLVLPWHFIEEFTKREKDYLNDGGKFIVPCPEFKIIGA